MAGRFARSSGESLIRRISASISRSRIPMVTQRSPWRLRRRVRRMRSAEDTPCASWPEGAGGSLAAPSGAIDGGRWVTPSCGRVKSTPFVNEGRRRGRRPLVLMRLQKRRSPVGQARAGSSARTRSRSPPARGQMTAAGGADVRALDAPAGRVAVSELRRKNSVRLSCAPERLRSFPVEAVPIDADIAQCMVIEGRKFR